MRIMSFEEDFPSLRNKELVYRNKTMTKKSEIPPTWKTANSVDFDFVKMPNLFFNEIIIQECCLDKNKVREEIKSAKYPAKWADTIEDFKERLLKDLKL